MKTKTAAHYLGMSETKLRGLDLPCKRDGGNVLYDREDLDAYADRVPYETKTRGNSCDGAFGAGNS